MLHNVEAELRRLYGKRTKDRILPIKNLISSLVRESPMNHVRVTINLAKGGDPMSHGSAWGSVLSVREMRG